MDEQIDLFVATLRPVLEEKVRSITLGHIDHVQDVLQLRDELVVKIDVNMQEVPA